MARYEHLEAEWLALLQGAERQGRELWRETLERMADPEWTRNWANVGDAPWTADGNDADDTSAADAIPPAFRQLWEALGEAQGDEDGVDRAFDQLHEQLDALFRMMEGATVPGVVLRAFREAAGPESGLDGVPPWMAPWAQVGLARLGPLRPHQERLDALLRAAEAHQESSRRCLALLHGSAREGLKRLHARLAGTPSPHAAETDDAPAEPAASPESLRELYGLWIEESEHAYEELLRSDEWADAFGAYSNAASELLEAFQQQADAWLRMLDLPNREDVVDSQRRIIALERRQRADGDTRVRDEVASLRQEVAALRSELNAVKGSSDGT